MSSKSMGNGEYIPIRCRLCLHELRRKAKVGAYAYEISYRRMLPTFTCDPTCIEIHTWSSQQGMGLILQTTERETLQTIELMRLIMQNEQSVEQLNRLLRGELSAIETYEQALQKVKDVSATDTLRRIAEDHRTAADLLRQHVSLFGGTPDHDSGAWGVWARTVEGAAAILGDTVALKALKEGEEHGLKEYQDVASDENLAFQCRNLINSDLMTRQRQHIGSLNRMMHLPS